MNFELKSPFKPKGDQPKAIDEITKGLEDNLTHQVLLGVTGSGKTFTMANIIANLNRPTLVIAHNKTLAYQLASEFKAFFPNNIVEYFVSYYDYYQPEAYVPGSDTYIEKDAQVNEEIDRLRHSATAALFERRDVLIVASVSCIYGLGDPEDYIELMISLRVGMRKDIREVMRELISIRYERNDINFIRGTFRVRGDTLEIFPAGQKEETVRIEFFGDEIEKISVINHITGEVLGVREHQSIFPASHFTTGDEKMKRAIITIEEELEERLKFLRDRDKLLEAQRLEQRTRYDLEMLSEMGFCQGIENYSRHLSGREAGSRPYTLIDYFPKDFLMFIDESHATVPQIGGMYEGDKSRKTTLVEYGFRLPSALDNRPLRFNEFEKLVNQVVYTSATPGKYEKEHTQKTVEQIVRPTGLLDPVIEVRPTKNQIDNLISEINEVVGRGERVLITTLTKRMAEDLTKYFGELGMKVAYLHSDVETIERMEILRDLRGGKYDVLVGINLLREGLDLPEVSFVAVLDADKEGFLRSETSLVQTSGRAARNVHGKVIFYADTITHSMQNTINITERRRSIQEAYNKEHNIIPQSVQKDIRDVIEATKEAKGLGRYDEEVVDRGSILEIIESLEVVMMLEAEKLNFEKAAEIRDKIIELKKQLEHNKK